MIFAEIFLGGSIPEGGEGEKGNSIRKALQC